LHDLAYENPKFKPLAWIIQIIPLIGESYGRQGVVAPAANIRGGTLAVPECKKYREFQKRKKCGD